VANPGLKDLTPVGIRVGPPSAHRLPTLRHATPRNRYCAAVAEFGICVRMELAAAAKMALLLMREHGLAPKWEFTFDRAVLRFGSCNWRRKRITLSAALVRLNAEEEVRDTILHEIAHALTSPRSGHGRKWKEVARAIGCRPERCYGENVILPGQKYRGSCPSCGRSIRRSRRSRVSCGHCDRRFNPTHLFVWTLCETSQRASENVAAKTGGR
jgi:predicted SprT family Zn-dependent metalloprotease